MALTKVPGFIVDTSSSFTVANLSVGNVSTTGNLTSGNVQASGYFWSNGAPFASSNYGNTQVASYLAGNITVGNIRSTGFFWANGSPFVSGGGGGTSLTTGATPPVSPTVGAEWYNTNNDILYVYLNDGTSNYWVDISGITNSNIAINGTSNARAIGYSMVFGG